MYDQHTLTRQFSNSTQSKTQPKRLHLEKKYYKTLLFSTCNWCMN